MRKAACLILVFILLCAPMRVSALGTSAKAAILINGDTGEVIYEQNADVTLPMASTTKIMTALLLCEHGDFEKEVTVTAEMLRVEGSSMGLLSGDRVTLGALLYGLMLASGNDAANVVAYTLGGTVNGFVKKMNDKAAELGLTSTRFVTPSGLDADGHYTTARDLARLSMYAMRNKDFAAAADCETAVLEYGNPPYRRSLSNHNKLLKNYDSAVGIKTGFTKKSGRCLVSAAKKDGRFVIAVTLNDPNDWSDHTSMLEYGLSAVTETEITPERDSYEVPVIGAEVDNIKIEVEPHKLCVLSADDLSCTVNLPKFVYAPIEKGEKIGSAIYKKGEKIIATAELCAQEAIAAKESQKSLWDKVAENIKYIFTSIWEK